MNHSFPKHKRQSSINWKLHDEKESQDCFSLLEVSSLSESGKAKFNASIGEIFLPMLSKNLLQLEEERMFISRRLCMMGDSNLVEDFICLGCQLCEAPLNSELGSASDLSSMPLYCPKSSSYKHQIGAIYRPFMLYVWDESIYIPLLVKDKAAELLFGNIKAEKVIKCYRRMKQLNKVCHQDKLEDADHSDPRPTCLNTSEKGIASSHLQTAKKRLGVKETEQYDTPNFYLIWLILLRALMQQGKNSPLKFKVTVNLERDPEDGRFEMISVSMPCYGASASVV